MRITPFRGEYHDLVRAARHLVARPDLPRARPGLPVPRRAPHPMIARRGARRAQRGAGAGPRGIPVARRRRAATWPRWPATRACGDWPGTPLAHRRWPRCGDRCRPRRSSAGPAAPGARVTADDLVPAPSGVRAQALRPRRHAARRLRLRRDGARSLHVLNAPSPAATASLAIGERDRRAGSGRRMQLTDRTQQRRAGPQGEGPCSVAQRRGSVGARLSGEGGSPRARSDRLHRLRHRCG